ncbi:hypothetical protein BJX64DRAFT_269012 [Aspergillus heterothallicus]
MLLPQARVSPWAFSLFAVRMWLFLALFPTPRHGLTVHYWPSIIPIRIVRSSRAVSTMYREPRRLANILKCRFCRRDKRRCVPEKRVWPGQKCDACKRYGYDCSTGLSAEQEKAEQQRQADKRQQQQQHEQQYEGLVVGASGDQGIVASAYTHTQRQFERGLQPSRDFDVTTGIVQPTAPAQNACPPQTVPSEQLIKLRPDATNPNSLTLYIPRAAGRRMEFAGTLDLEERLMRLWANPETYEQACSSRLAITCSELFIHIRRIAESDELIFSSLFAFIAGNLGVYANRPIALQLEAASRQYLERSFNMLKTYMDQAAQSPNGTPRPGTILPMQYACFLLACYGSSTSEPQLIEFMVKQLDLLRRYSASFPLRVGVVLQPPDGWRFSIYRILRNAALRLATTPRCSGRP